MNRVASRVRVDRGRGPLGAALDDPVVVARPLARREVELEAVERLVGEREQQERRARVPHLRQDADAADGRAVAVLRRRRVGHGVAARPRLGVPVGVPGDDRQAEPVVGQLLVLRHELVDDPGERVVGPEAAVAVGRPGRVRAGGSGRSMPSRAADDAPLARGQPARVALHPGEHARPVRHAGAAPSRRDARRAAGRRRRRTPAAPSSAAPTRPGGCRRAPAPSGRPADARAAAGPRAARSRARGGPAIRPTRLRSRQTTVACGGTATHAHRDTRRAWCALPHRATARAARRPLANTNASERSRSRPRRSAVAWTALRPSSARGGTCTVCHPRSGPSTSGSALAGAADAASSRRRRREALITAVEAGPPRPRHQSGRSRARASASRRLISSHCGGARALERPAAAQLLAVQHEDGVAALERLRPGDAAALLVAAAVPHGRRRRSRACRSARRFAAGFERRLLRQRPGPHLAVDLQAQLVAPVALQDGELAGGHAADPELLVPLDARGLGRTGSPANASSASTASGSPSAWSSPAGRTQPITPSSRACAATAWKSPPATARTAFIESSVTG